jgi:hypothetical protein
VVLLLGAATGILGEIAAVSIGLGISISIAGLGAFHTYRQREENEQPSPQQSAHEPSESGPTPNTPPSKSNRQMGKPGANESSNNLHECPECVTVYLSVNPGTCSNCNAETTPV